MTRNLKVYLHRQLVGRLSQDAQGRIRFAYETGWLSDPDARPLSRSLPLRPERFNPRETEPFFGGLLPEEDLRTVIARNLGISARNSFAMLAEVGGEIAGAVSLIPEDDSLPESRSDYRRLSDEALTEILRELPRRPLLAGAEGVRLSLAGVQSKLPVKFDGDTFSLPLGIAPSSHIIKPANDRFPGLIANEAFCMQLARSVGLLTADTSIRRVGGVEFLLIERYDRTLDDDGEIDRLHQEDFCQALGVPSIQKYQAEGGPGVADLFRVIREATTTPVTELPRLIDAIVFNVLIGNNDAHAKNFSLFYRGRAVTLAPLYDLVSTAYYPELSSRMAMTIGNARSGERISRADWEAMATTAGLNRLLVLERAENLTREVLASLDNTGIDDPVADELSVQMRSRCEEMLERAD